VKAKTKLKNIILILASALIIALVCINFFNEKPLAQSTPSIELNAGLTSIEDDTNVLSNVDNLGTDSAVYSWTVDGGEIMTLNYPFNTGTTQTDFSGSGNHGTPANGAATSNTDCVVGHCISFDGSNDQLNTTAINVSSDELTISMWVNDVFTNTNPWSTIIAIKPIGSSSACGLVYDIPSDTFYNFCTTSGVNMGTIATVTDNDWHHLVGVWSKTTGRKIYLDGVMVNSRPDVLDSTSDLTGTLETRIGWGRTGAGGEYFKGGIDELQIYNRALSAEQISILYNDGLQNLASPRSIHKNETDLSEQWNLSVTPITTAGLIGSPVTSSNTVDIEATVTCSNPPADLVSWWDGDDISGSTVNDIFGSNSGIFENGATTANGHTDDAISLDGTTSQRVLIANHSSLEPQVFTVGAWVKANSLLYGVQGPVVVTKDTNTAGNGVSYAILGPGTTGKFNPNIRFTDGTQPSLFTTSTFTTGVWYYLALSC